MTLIISNKLANTLNERLKYNVLVECPELSDYFQLQNVEIVSLKQSYKTDIYSTSIGTFVQNKPGIAIPINKALNYVLIKQGECFGLWKTKTKDISTDNPEIFTYEKGELLNKDTVYVYRKIDGEYYVTYKALQQEVTMVKDIKELRRELLRVYLEMKKRRLLWALHDKYEISSNLKAIKDRWVECKVQYKKLKKDFKKHVERGILSTKITRKELRNAGWRFYRYCEPVEPPEPVIEEEYEIQALWPSGLVLQTNGLRVAIEDVPPEIAATKENFAVTVTDGRIVKYLKYKPGCLTTNLSKIPYFKWAVCKVFEAILKGRRRCTC